MTLSYTSGALIGRPGMLPHTAFRPAQPFGLSAARGAAPGAQESLNFVNFVNVGTLEPRVAT